MGQSFDYLVVVVLGVANVGLAAERRMHSRRRWSLPAGIVLLQAVQAQIGIPLTISRDGLREGVIAQLLGEGDPPLHRGSPLHLAAVRAS